MVFFHSAQDMLKRIMDLKGKDPKECIEPSCEAVKLCDTV